MIKNELVMAVSVDRLKAKVAPDEMVILAVLLNDPELLPSPI